MRGRNKQRNIKVSVRDLRLEQGSWVKSVGGKREERVPEFGGHQNTGPGSCSAASPSARGCYDWAPSDTRTSAIDCVVLTDCQSAPAAARCCLAPPGGSPGRPTGRGPISSRTRLAQNPGDRSLPLSTSPKGREGAVTANSFPEEGRNQGGLCVCAHVCEWAHMHAHARSHAHTKENSNHTERIL